MTARVDEVCYRDAYARDGSRRGSSRSRRPTARRSSSSTRRRSTRAAAASRPTAARSCARPTAGRGRSAPRAGSAARSSTSWSRPTTASCRRPATASQVDLEWARRYALMRTHTALHALCGVVWRDYGALVTGGNMEPGSGRMDFEFETMSGDLVGAIEATVNEELRAARDVRVNVLPARRGVRDPGPDPDQGQPAARGDRADPHDRDRGPRPPGRRRHPRRQHPRGRRDPGHRLRVQGPDQQAHPASSSSTRD